jgi:hypothetical protein
MRQSLEEPLPNDGEYFWWGYDMSKDKVINRLVKNIMYIVRKTPEYSYWAKNAKTYGDDTCCVCEIPYDKLSNRVDTHHYPLTLYEIIFNKLDIMIDNETIFNYTPLEFCKLIIDDHINGKVDFINICHFCHDKYHELVDDVRKKVYKCYQEEKKMVEG